MSESPLQPAVEFDHVWFGYDRDPVIHDATLVIDPGQVVAIVGPNGSGKTTLLKLVLGLLKPTGGTMRVLGTSPERARRAIGYVPQHAALDQRFPVSVLDVVLMGRLGKRLLGFYNRDDHAIARQALRDMQLEKLADQSFFALSGGQRQRVLIARALATEPEMLLLDEPTANVDKTLSKRLYEQLEELSSRMTVIFVSHDIHFVSSIVTHVICIDKTVQIHHTSEIQDETLLSMFGPEYTLVRHDAKLTEGHKHSD